MKKVNALQYEFPRCSHARCQIRRRPLESCCSSCPERCNPNGNRGLLCGRCSFQNGTREDRSTKARNKRKIIRVNPKSLRYNYMLVVYIFHLVPNSTATVVIFPGTARAVYDFVSFALHHVSISEILQSDFCGYMIPTVQAYLSPLQVHVLRSI